MIIYRIISPAGLSYVGVAHDPDERFKAHARSPWLIGRAIRKYGAGTMRLEYLTEGTVDFCYAVEDHYIQRYNALTPNGYNMVGGGKGITRHSPEVRERMRASAKARWADPVKRAVALASITTPEVKAKQSAYWKENPMKPETRIKIGRSRKGFRATEKTKRLQSEGMKQSWRRRRAAQGVS